MKRFLLMSALLTAACSRTELPTGSSVLSNDPAATGPLADALIVSDPGLSPGSAAGGSAVRAVAATFAYVSLPPGYLADGSQVRIGNLRTTQAAKPMVVGGGFDPISIPAVLGDTLDVAVTTGSAPVAHTLALIQAARPPRVVRINPPTGRLNVPLNMASVIVISEPADPGTVLDNPIRLRLGAVTIGGTLTFDSTGTMLTFAPGSPLEPATTYELDVTRALTDQSGTSLESATTVSFTTAGLEWSLRH